MAWGGRWFQRSCPRFPQRPPPQSAHRGLSGAWPRKACCCSGVSRSLLWGPHPCWPQTAAGADTHRPARPGLSASAALTISPALVQACISLPSVWQSRCLRVQRGRERGAGSAPRASAKADTKLDALCVIKTNTRQNSPPRGRRGCTPLLPPVGGGSWAGPDPRPYGRGHAPAAY